MRSVRNRHPVFGTLDCNSELFYKLERLTTLRHTGAPSPTIHPERFARWICLLCVLVGAGGCAQLLGADDYTKQEADASSDAADQADSERPEAEGGSEPNHADAGAALPLMPPYYTGTDCTPCIAERCREAEQACSEEASCSRFLERAREFGSQRAPMLELGRDYMEAEWALNRGEPNGWNVVLELQRCVRQRCTAECELGRDLACVGGFDWSESTPETKELRLRIVDAPMQSGLAGLRARACPATDYGPCAVPLAETNTDDGGFVSLFADLSASAVQWRRAEFDGSVLIDGNEAYPPYRIALSRPFYSREYFPSYVWDRATIAVAAQGSGLSLPAESWSLMVAYPLDCRYDYMKSITLEAWKSAPGGLEPCTRCTVAYTNGGGLIDPTLTEPSLQGVPIFVIAPTDELNGLTIVARDKRSGQLVSVLRRGSAVPDEALVAYMFPASRSQLAALPEELTH